MKVLSNIEFPEKQLENEIIKYCRQGLKRGLKRRKSIRNLEDWNIYREDLMDIIKSAFPPIMFNYKNPLNARIISKHRFENFRIENVIFESLEGWEVNASVYLPKEEGIYPGVVCPTGHSSKLKLNYQRSCQVLAQNGYIVVSFDPPGCVGEISHMNDHFTNGLIGYLTGFWSQAHFIIDSIRCIDYLETRNDVDISKGFTMTGVSGGGLSTIFSSILDDRIKFSAPVCCLAGHENIHFKDLYTSCPEQFGHKFIENGIGYADYLSLIAPTNCLIIAGKKDEVFDYRITKKIFEDAKDVYIKIGSGDKINFFLDDESGHGYTVKMANVVVGYMNKIIKGIEKDPLKLTENDVLLLDDELLKCHPSNDINMFTINKDEQIRLYNQRKHDIINDGSESLRTKVKKILNVKDSYDIHKVEVETNSTLRWCHTLQKIDIIGEEKYHIPGLLLKRDDNKKRAAVLFIDDNGKWNGLKHDNFLARLGGFLQREDNDNEPMILSIDCAGLGELTPEPTAYDMAYWNDIERILTYLSIAANRPIMGLRVRDALCAINYLENRDDVSEIIIGGEGIGAIVALHAAIIWGKASKIICIDMLVNYRSMTEKSPFLWQQSIIIPNILKEYDLEDLIKYLSDKPILLINPLDAQQNHETDEELDYLYKDIDNKNVKIYNNISKEIQKDKIVEFVWKK